MVVAHLRASLCIAVIANPVRFAAAGHGGMLAESVSRAVAGARVVRTVDTSPAILTHAGPSDAFTSAQTGMAVGRARVDRTTFALPSCMAYALLVLLIALAVLATVVGAVGYPTVGIGPSCVTGTPARLAYSMMGTMVGA